MEKPILYQAVPMSQRSPGPNAYAMIYCVLLDGRIQMMAQWRPKNISEAELLAAYKEGKDLPDRGGEWWSLGMAQAKPLKAVTHWLEQVEITQVAEEWAEEALKANIQVIKQEHNPEVREANKTWFQQKMEDWAGYRGECGDGGKVKPDQL
jgi:hypothetical protein